MSTSVGKKAEAKTSAPSAVLDPPKVRRVRNRELHPITGSLTGERSFERYELPSGIWKEVTESVFQHLKGKFGKPRFRTVVDYKANEKNPHEYGETHYKQEQGVGYGFNEQS